MEVDKDGALPKEIRLELEKLPRFQEAEDSLRKGNSGSGLS